jgi:hypothetical protein
LADVPANLGAVECGGILDFAGATESVAVAARSVRNGGAIVSTARVVPESVASQNRVVATNYMLDEKPARLDYLANSLATGSVRPVIGDVLSLEDAAGGCASNHDGLRGKTVIRVR